jgi:glycyl-tRNA synthetase beta subunit
MVMVDDEALKNNRLALLQQLFRCFRQVADFSKIQSK